MPVCCQLPNLRESHNFQDAWSNATRRAQYLRFIFSRAKRLIVVIARDDHWSLLPIFAALDRGWQPKADPNLYLENCRDLWDESQSFRGLQGSNNWIQDTLKLVALWNEDDCIQLHTNFPHLPSPSPLNIWAYHHHQLHPRHPGTRAANLREILQTNDLNGAKEYIVEGTPEKGPVTSGMGKCMEMSWDASWMKWKANFLKANKLLDKSSRAKDPKLQRVNGNRAGWIGSFHARTSGQKNTPAENNAR